MDLVFASIKIQRKPGIESYDAKNLFETKRS